MPLKTEAVVELFVMAPALLKPVPDGMMGSTESDVRLNPFKSSVAPLMMVVAPPDVPKGPELVVLDRPNFIMPLLMVVAPEKEPKPDNFQVPVPSLMRVPVVVFKGLVSTPPCVPPIVKLKVAPVMAPVLLILMEPVSPIMLEGLPNVMVPGYVAEMGELFMIAPLLEIPVPRMVNASAFA